MTWTRGGTVAITNGQTTVTGTGTNFTNGRVGDEFKGPDGLGYEVTNILSPTSIAIFPAYKGATVSGGAYAIVPVQGYPKALADAVNALVQQWGGALAGLGAVSTEDVVPVAKGGTGGTTPALGRSGLGLKSAAVADILGTVSQSGGVPTGAIIERGANANGTYIRFADGTQICHVNLSLSIPITGAAGSLFVSDVASITWPIAFLAAPSVSSFAGRASTDANIVSLALRSYSAVDCYYRWTNTFSSPSMAVIGSIIAVGRWY